MGERLDRRVVVKPDGRYLILYSRRAGEDVAERARDRFRSRFGADPAAVASAPGRVNLIGEHVDYLGGLVLPAAIDRRLGIAVGPAAAWEVDSDVAGGAPYLRALGEELDVGPVRAAIVSEVPAGAGLSSSAALLVAAAAALAPGLDGLEAARRCQRAEQRATGVQVGIMDQVAAALGREGFAILLDCGTLAHELVPFPDHVAIAVLDSGVRRRLADTPYNKRREQAIAALGGASSPEHERRRRHVTGEALRVRRFVDALRAGDVAALGRLLDESHRSLRDDFEVSTPEVERAAEAARRAPGCLGARVMGAGFGGAILALVESPATEAFQRALGGRAMLLRTATGPFAR